MDRHSVFHCPLNEGEGTYTQRPRLTLAGSIKRNITQSCLHNKDHRMNIPVAYRSNPSTCLAVSAAPMWTRTLITPTPTHCDCGEDQAAALWHFLVCKHANVSRFAAAVSAMCRPLSLGIVSLGYEAAETKPRLIRRPTREKIVTNDRRFFASTAHACVIRSTLPRSPHVLPFTM